MEGEKSRWKRGEKECLGRDIMGWKKEEGGKRKVGGIRMKREGKKGGRVEWRGGKERMEGRER